jgi:hypothetical protein
MLRSIPQQFRFMLQFMLHPMLQHKVQHGVQHKSPVVAKFPYKSYI